MARSAFLSRPIEMFCLCTRSIMATADLEHEAESEESLWNKGGF